MSRLKLFSTLPILWFAGCSSKPSIPPAATQQQLSSAPAASSAAPNGAPAPAGQTQAAMPPAGQQPAAAAAPAAQPEPELTLPEGTVLRVRLAQSLDTKKNRAGDRFKATLDAAVVVDNKVVIPKGANFSGIVDEAKNSGRLKGRAVMNLSLDSFEMNGKVYKITTSHVDRVSGRHKK